MKRTHEFSLRIPYLHILVFDGIYSSLLPIRLFYRILTSLLINTQTKFASNDESNSFIVVKLIESRLVPWHLLGIQLTITIDIMQQIICLHCIIVTVGKAKLQLNKVEVKTHQCHFSQPLNHVTPEHNSNKFELIRVGIEMQ